MTNISSPISTPNRQITNTNLINNYLSEIAPSLLSKKSPEKIILSLSIISKAISQTNSEGQIDYYQTMSQKGLTQIVNFISQSTNETIRKLSTKIIVDLLYDNQTNQNKFCEKFGFTPIGGAICLNWIPKKIKEHLNIDEDMLYYIRKSQYEKNENGKFWLWPPNDIYNDDNYPDPYKYFIGFYLNQNCNMIYENKGYRKIDIQEVIHFLEKGTIEETPNVGSMTTSSSLTNHQKSEKKNEHSRSIECKNSRQPSNYASKYRSTLSYQSTLDNNSHRGQKLNGEKNYKFNY